MERLPPVTRTVRPITKEERQRLIIFAGGREEIFRGIPLERVTKEFHVGARAYRFTEEERSSLREALTTITRSGKVKPFAPAASLDGFIGELERLCSVRRYWFIDRPDRGAPTREMLREYREKILTDCKATLGHLGRIYRCESDVCRYDDMTPFLSAEAENPTTDFRMQSWAEAEDAMLALERFVKTLELYHAAEAKRTGRPPADDDRFVRCVARIFEQHLGRRPTATKDGPFSAIIRLVLGVEYPDRAIKAALK